VVSILVWMWNSDPPSAGEVEIGGGIALPTYASGPGSHSWWAMVVLLLVAAALYLSYLFGFLYLWTVAPEAWPRQTSLPSPASAWVSLAALGLSTAALAGAHRLLGHGSRRRGVLIGLLFAGAAALAGALLLDIAGHWQAGLRPQSSGYSAMVYANAVLQAQIVAAVVFVALFAGARLAAGRLDPDRRVVFDVMRLLWVYALGQAAFGLLLTHGFPLLVAQP
jgi:cytochrome c oxidase subunit I+III